MSDSSPGTAEARNRQHLENSRPLPWDRSCNAVGWPPALDRLMTALEGRETRARKRKADDRRRLREVLGAIILALYAAHRADPEQWLAYARRNDDYGADQRRYVHPHATAKAARAVVDFLTAVGLVEHRGGSFSRGEIGNRGTRSRARARAARQSR